MHIALVLADASPNMAYDDLSNDVSCPVTGEGSPATGVTNSVDENSNCRLGKEEFGVESENLRIIQLFDASVQELPF